MVYLHYAHAIGLERLVLLMDEMFSLSISEGAISNMLARARQPLLAPAAAIQTTVTASPVVCSDETSARVSGKTWWEWVFIGTFAVLHVIRPSRGKAVVQDLFGSLQPLVWVSDMLGSQRGHALQCGRSAWRICCATRAMPSSAAIPHSAPRSSACCCAPSPSADDESGCKTPRCGSIWPTSIAGSTGSWRLSRWASRGASCASASPPTGRICSCSSPTADVPYTNNVSERHLRPSVIFRKVTNGFRCEWGAETYAAFRSVVSTAKANRASVLDILRFVLAAKLPVEPLAEVG